MRPSLRQDDFDLEKQVILEEIAKYEDQPPFGAHEKCMAEHFGNHPLSRNVLGSTDSVESLTRAQMREYFDRRYSPSNMLLVAAGNVDFDQLVRQADAHCGKWKRFPVSREMPQAAGRAECRVFEKPTSTQQYVVQACDSPAADSDDRHAGRLLAAIVGDDSGSRFFWELVDTGRAECASVGAYEFLGAGILMTVLCCAPEDAADNLRRMHDIEQEVQLHGITEEELVRAKSKICAHVILQGERPTNRMFSVGMNWLQRREYKTVREAVNAYRAVTLDHVTQYLKKYPLTRKTTVAVGPLTRLET
jgi:predicted Zn-dependent peptidase